MIIDSYFQSKQKMLGKGTEKKLSTHETRQCYNIYE